MPAAAAIAPWQQTGFNYESTSGLPIPVFFNFSMNSLSPPIHAAAAGGGSGGGRKAITLVRTQRPTLLERNGSGLTEFN
jgi:hypothetical protein